MNKYKKFDGGPAFPVAQSDESGRIVCDEHGASLRDYFAAKALSSLLSPDADEAAVKEAARLAYDAADAMLAVGKGVKTRDILEAAINCLKTIRDVKGDKSKDAAWMQEIAGITLSLIETKGGMV
jgi:hypothetical protein